MLTGTRAAMLVYPVAICLSLLATKQLVSRKHKFLLVSSVPLLLLICGFVFKAQIEQRIADFKTNMQLIDKPEIDNSIISRLSMQTLAWRTGSQAPWGQSAEQRGEEIRAMVAQQPRLSGVMPYINVHLHNELLETYSLKGYLGRTAAAGALCQPVLLFLPAAAQRAAAKRQRQPVRLRPERRHLLQHGRHRHILHGVDRRRSFRPETAPVQEPTP